MDFKLDPITGFTWIHWNTLYFLVDHGRLHFHIDDSVFEDGPTLPTGLTLPEDLNFILLSNYESAAWFIHNYASFLVQHGLPSSTHLLATKPTLELARICLEEGCHYPCPTYEKAYCILESRLHGVMFGEHWKMDAITSVLCCSSGYILGSCNWVVYHGNQSLGIFTSSSTHPERYFKALDLQRISNCTVLLLTSMAMELHLDWEQMCLQFQTFIFQQLNEKKSLLIPQCISKVGYWDTFNLLFRFFLSQPNFQRDWHWLVISKESAKIIAYANTALAFLSSWGQDMVEHMQMPVFFLGHPKLADLKFHIAQSISDPIVGQVYPSKKIVISKLHPLLKGLMSCGTGIGEKFPLDPRLRISDLHATLQALNPSTIVTMGAVPEMMTSWFSEYRWRNALNEPIHLDPSLIPVKLSPEWLEYEKSVPQHEFQGVPIKKVFIQWDLTTNTIHPITKCRDLISAQTLNHESRYIGYFEFQKFIELLIQKGAPFNVKMEKNVATFPDIPCQIKYDPESRDIDVAFDKVDHSDFKSLIEACLTELMLEINV